MRKQCFLLSKSCRCAYLTVSVRTPLELCTKRNATRDCRVPESVIKRMDSLFEWPDAESHPWERHNLDLSEVETSSFVDAIEDFTDFVLQKPLLFIDTQITEEEKQQARHVTKSNPVHVMDDILRSLVNSCISSLPPKEKKLYGKDFSKAKVLTFSQLKCMAAEKFKQPGEAFELWIRAAFSENVALLVPCNVYIS
ncbi:unnamed protein product [Mesocestoides corti]|nr:unnamed protein product [Mesocestoides corti]